mmetsp:Transcript_42770/g.99019  ORF Transcript_42770/g.99019 Transcript_42770/m.99019 type:complete len:219 (-) Transcript_42770:37-693(-)
MRHTGGHRAISPFSSTAGTLHQGRQGRGAGIPGAMPCTPTLQLLGVRLFLGHAHTRLNFWLFGPVRPTVSVHNLSSARVVEASEHVGVALHEVLPGAHLRGFHIAQLFGPLLRQPLPSFFTPPTLPLIALLHHEVLPVFVNVCNVCSLLLGCSVLFHLHLYLLLFAASQELLPGRVQACFGDEVDRGASLLLLCLELIEIHPFALQQAKDGRAHSFLK